MASGDDLMRVAKIRNDLTCPEISIRDISIEDNVFGSGGFGSVHKGSYRGEVVAVKVIDWRKYSERHKQMILACKEARSMCMVEHASILKIYGIILDDLCGLVLEFMEHGSLKDLQIHTKLEGFHIPIGIQVQMMRDISEALRYLHSQKLVHADLKLGNILINDKMEAKLGDFGLSSFQGFTSELTNSFPAKGTLSHMAPELFNPQLVGRDMPKNSPQTDVWSFGIMVFDLMNEEPLFHGLQPDVIKHQIGRGIKDYCMAELMTCEPTIFVEVVSTCLEYQPTDRTDFESITRLLHDKHTGEFEKSYRDDINTLNYFLQKTALDEQAPRVTVLSERTVYREVMNCPAHKDYPLQFYCEQCEIPICSLCLTSTHNEHKLKDMKEAAKKVDDALRKLLEACRGVTQLSKELCEKLKRILESLEQQQKACESKIKQFYTALLALTDTNLEEIKRCENKAIVQLNNQMQVARKQVEDAYNRAKRNRAMVSTAVEDVSKMLSTAQEGEKLQKYKKIRSRLENLNVERIEARMKKPAFKLQDGKVSVAELSVNIGAELGDEDVSFKFSVNFAKNLTVSSEPPVPRVTRPPAVKEPVQLERKFSSVLEEGKGWCEGLAVGGGVLVVTDSVNKNVNVFDKNDLTLKFTFNQTQHRLQCPGDVTCNRLGEIFIMDRGIHGVVKYDAAGRLMEIYPDVYKGDGYITSYVDQLIVADRGGGRLMLTDFDFKVQHQIGARSLGLSEFSPGSVCVDENTGHLVVTQWTPPRVYVIDHTQPAVIHTFSDQLCEPWGVCVDQFGHILVADLTNHQVIQMTPAGAHVITTRGDVSSPTAICTSGPGQVYVLELRGVVKIFKYLDI